MDELLKCLADQNVSTEVLSKRKSFEIEKRWTASFGRFAEGTRHLNGARAVNQFLEQCPDSYWLLFLSAKIGAFPISVNQRPCCAVRCHGPAVDLSAYHDLEFALFPLDYAWTLVHTHEDDALVGPVFVQASDCDAAGNN